MVGQATEIAITLWRAFYTHTTELQRAFGADCLSLQPLRALEGVSRTDHHVARLTVVAGEKGRVQRAEVLLVEHVVQIGKLGVKLAQFWLDSFCSGWLWAVMIAERDLLPRAIDRRAFEVGFLGRVHQRLRSHEADRLPAAGVAFGHDQPERRPPSETACRC